MENLKNGLQNENASCFINPMFEIEILKDVTHTRKSNIEAGDDISEIVSEQATCLPLNFIIHQYLKDYGFNPSIADNFVVILRLSQGAEIRMPLFLKSLPDNWKHGQDIPGGVIYEKPKNS